MNFSERRKSPRFTVRERSLLQSAVGDTPYDCLLVNLSKGGARVVALDVAVPRNFLITSQVNRSHKYRCAMVWQDGPTLGVQFTPALRVAPYD